MNDALTALSIARDAKRLSNDALMGLEKWLTEEEFAQFVPEVVALIAMKDWEQVEDAFYTRIKVGTGGIRGPIGSGPNRINNRTIGEAAQALSNFIHGFGDEAVAKGVIVGHEVRKHSREYAEICSEVFAANGIKTYLFDHFRSTPELSFAIRHLGVTAGVQLTASHNPRTDNGFKFYWTDGGQVVPPLDQKFMNLVGEVESLKSMDFAEAKAIGLIEEVGAEIDSSYLGTVRGLSLVPTRSATIAYSPIHGAGSTSVLPVLRQEGFDVTTVAQQLAPDENFPTAFGNLINPEFPEVMAMPKQLAEQIGADLALMSDPDADRIGVGVKVSFDSSEIRLVSGNEVGIALTHFILSVLKEQGKLAADDEVIETSVTSSLIGEIAESFGVKAISDLLVGFKFVGEIISHLPHEDEFIFAAEESLGYLRGTYARDKDAAVSALMIAEMTSWLKDSGRTVLSYLDDIYGQFGYFENRLKLVEPGQGRIGKDHIAAIMKGLRAHPPQEIAGLSVLEVVDRLDEGLRDPKKYITGATGDQLTYILSDDGRTKVTVRPSGTEPAIKFYVQCYGPIEGGLSEVKLRVDKLAKRLELAIQEYAEVNRID